MADTDVAPSSISNNSYIHNTIIIDGDCLLTHPKIVPIAFEETIEPRNIKELKESLKQAITSLNSLYSDTVSSKLISQILNIYDVFRGYTYSISAKYNAQLVNNSWMKIWEILSHYALIPVSLNNESYITFDYSNNSGASISAVNHYIKTMTNIKSHIWFTSSDDPVKCLKTNYRSRWIENAMDESITNQAHLFVGDYSDDTKDYVNQEESYIKKYIDQLLHAFKILKEGGNAIFKLYGFFTPLMQSLLFLLYESFNEVSIIKPSCSKLTNGECYLVCLKFKTVTVDTVTKLTTYCDPSTTPFIPPEKYTKGITYTLYEFYNPYLTTLQTCLETYDKLNIVSEDSIKHVKNDYRTYYAIAQARWIEEFPVKNLKLKDKLKTKEF